MRPWYQLALIVLTRKFLLVVSLAAWGCQPRSASPDPAHPQGPAAPQGSTGPRDSRRGHRDGGNRAESCPLVYGTRLREEGSVYRVSAYVRNRTGRVISLELPDRCPQGPAAFRGLPPGYDYYGACAMGACAEPAGRLLRFDIPARSEIGLATIDIDPRGGSCTTPLAPGDYEVSFAMPDAHSDCVDELASIRQGAILPAPAPETTPPPDRPSTRREPRCPPMPACGIGCPGPMARDENGCTLCACEEMNPVVQPATPR